MRDVEPLVTPVEAAKILGVAVQSLANWRATKRHPLSYVKLGRNGRVMYRMRDLQAFIESQVVVVEEP